MNGKYFLDTNVLVYALDRTDPGKQSRSQDLIFGAFSSGEGVLSPQVLSEFFVTVTRKIKNPLSSETARKVILHLSTLCTVDLDATLVVKAVDIQRRLQLSYWDGMILAAAERADCQWVYSEDLSHGQQYGQVQVINPFKT